MEPLFQDDKLQAQFETEGYIVMPFLDANGLAQLRQHYTDLHAKTPGEGFYSTTFSPDAAYKKRLYEGIKTAINAPLSGTFTQFKELGASFLVKNPGKPGFMPVHQDWTVVDESQFRSVTIWIPLEDVDATNGAITVLPGSQAYTRILRGPTLPPVFREVDAEIRSRMRTLNMKAGEAFIFDHSLIHASHLNQSDRPRIAATFGLVPGAADLCYYYRDSTQPDAPVEKYAVNDDFFLTYHQIGSRPTEAEKVEEISMEFPPITKPQFESLYQQYSLPIHLNANKKHYMKPVFKDPELEAQFIRDGYVKIQLLEQEEVAHLLEFYQGIETNIPEYGFHVSMDVQKGDQVMRVMDELKKVLGRKCDQFFQDYKIFTGSYVVKEINPKGVVPPHQDWTFVDEEEYWSATLWTPLVDVNMDNGALGVIHGSSNFFDFPRASPSPQVKTPLGEHMFSIFPYLDIIDMMAGEALVFNNRTIHASAPNTTEATRVACGIGITHKDAQLYHHYQVPGTEPAQVEVYEITEKFFHDYNNTLLSNMYNDGKKPEGVKVARTYEAQDTSISNEALMAMIKAHPDAKMNGPLIEKMARLFNYNMDGSKKEEPQPTPEPVHAGTSAGQGGIFARLKRFLGGGN